MITPVCLLFSIGFFAQYSLAQNDTAQNFTIQNVTAENTSTQNPTTQNITVENTIIQNVTVQNSTAEDSTTQYVTAGNTITQNTSTTTQNITAENTTIQNSTAQKATAQIPTSQNTTAQDADIEEEFRRARIVPHGIPTAPKEWLRIIYENRTLQTGELIENEMDLLQLPKIKWKSAHLRKLYTVYMFGLTDIPWRETRYEMSDGANFGLADGCNRTRQFHCWVQVNVPGDRVRKGESLFPYISPDCPSTEFTDRIVVLTYGQNFLVNVPADKATHAKLFSQCSPTSRLVKKLNLTGPIAGNFFYMKCDTINFMLEYP